ncbi:pilus assembly protein [Spartinivicinus ruber]|uniref:pilus assembly protein n=1 Tax=Spartinivicinus ruber TaxID=2683272 RepID=UPI0013D5F257|nr:PilC/PilY family type IV pilus protein [Spartinivicinus ruber]
MQTIKKYLKYILTFSFIFNATTNYADDTEIYVAPNEPPNVLIILDNSGSMEGTHQVGWEDKNNNNKQDSNEKANGKRYRDSFDLKGFAEPTKKCQKNSGGGNGGGSISNCFNNSYYDNNYRTRLQIIQDAAANVAANTNDINLGLMFFLYPGAFVASDFRDINEDQNRKALIDIIYNPRNAYPTNLGTPLSDTLYEAYLFYTGQTPKYGLTGKNGKFKSVGVSGSKYNSPFNEVECQQNSIVLFTDGDPSGDGGSNTEIKALIRNSTLPSGLGKCSGNCLDELAWYMGNNDLDGDASNNIKRTVAVNTIGGFGGAEPALLKSAASNSGGSFFNATNPNAVVQALKTAVSLASGAGTSNATPSVPVSATNSLELGNDLYFPVFKPAAGPNWQGNLKHYKFHNGKIVGTDINVTAISDGYFTEDVTSYWSSVKDGKDSLKGGMRSKLPTDKRQRKLYTYDSNDNNKLVELQNYKVFADYNVSDEAEWKTIIDWVYNEQIIGDPLHTNLQVVNYDKDNNGNITVSAYFGTNLGFIHAIDISRKEKSDGTTEDATNSGKELYGFIPPDLLKNLKIYKDNAVIDNKTKAYGLDGPLDTLIFDGNNDGKINNTDYVNLYISMRRGGNKVFALDITNRETPKLKWEFSSGDISQTWSMPNVMQVQLSNTPEFAVVFGGGYDPKYDSIKIDGTNLQFVDDNQTLLTDQETKGKKLYILNANTGTELKSFDTEASVTASVSALDTNNDKVVDLVFAVDIRGNIYRLDLKDSKKKSSKTDGYSFQKIASLSGDKPRLFYNQPDVSTVRLRGQSPYLSIALGSGYRAHPLDKTFTNRFYAIKEGDITTERKSTDVLSYSNLLDVSSRTKATTLQPSEETKLAKGWYINLDEGEKALSQSTTYAGALFFTTYIPEKQATVCKPGSGKSRLYAVNFDDGTSYISAATAGSSGQTSSQRYVDLKASGIPGQPWINENITSKDGKIPVFVGLEETEAQLDVDRLRKTFWRENRG